LDKPILKPPALRLADGSAAKDLFSWLEIGGTIGSALLFLEGHGSWNKAHGGFEHPFRGSSRASRHGIRM
jgi:hypothetical protein